jgi:hypothetical protein
MTDIHKVPGRHICQYSDVYDNYSYYVKFCVEIKIISVALITGKALTSCQEARDGRL